MPTYRFVWPQLYWWKDEEFNAFLKRFDELHANNSDRRWMLYQWALTANSIPGDTAECGVYRGAGSYLICKATQSGGQQRTHFIFDSFQGVSKPDEVDEHYWREGDLSCSLQDFQKPEATISIHPGWIPEGFPAAAEKKFCFVHIDVDLHQPTADSIAFFYPRMNTGGIMVFDDYGFRTCPGVKKAVDDFLADKPERIVHQSCGSAFITKL